MLALLYTLFALSGSYGKALWHDELFTCFIAAAPNLHVLWADVQTLDLNPPLVYLLTRASFSVFGLNALAARLPEMLFFALAMLGVSRFVARRAGPFAGCFAAACLLLAPAANLSFEARPYALLLGWLAWVLVTWQRLAEQGATAEVQVRSTAVHRAGSLAALLLSVSGLLLSHIFAAGALGAVLVAELWRQARARRVDIPILAALLLPCGLLWLYLPMLRAHGSSIYPPAFQPTGWTALTFYLETCGWQLGALAVTATLGKLLLGRKSSAPSQQSHRDSLQPFLEYEWVALLLLALLPLALLLVLMHTHAAFFNRYGSMATLPVVCAAAAGLCRGADWLGYSRPRTLLLGTAVAVLLSPHSWKGVAGLAQGRPFHSPAHALRPLRPCEACRLTSPADGRPALPLVDASGLTFVEMNAREPGPTLDRLFYLIDADASKRIAHANIFEQMPTVVDRFRLRGHAVHYSEFVRLHRHFFVLDRPGWAENWLRPRLLEQGATIKPLAAIHDEYEDRQLYEVTLAAAPPGAAR